jgi:hypothetical protein
LGSSSLCSLSTRMQNNPISLISPQTSPISRFYWRFGDSRGNEYPTDLYNHQIKRLTMRPLYLSVPCLLSPECFSCLHFPVGKAPILKLHDLTRVRQVRHPGTKFKIALGYQHCTCMNQSGRACLNFPQGTSRASNLVPILCSSSSSSLIPVPFLPSSAFLIPHIPTPIPKVAYWDIFQNKISSSLKGWWSDHCHFTARGCSRAGWLASYLVLCSPLFLPSSSKTNHPIGEVFPTLM